MATEPLSSLVYVVRLWRTSVEGQPVWRVLAQNSVTEERHVFASLEDFFAFFEEQTRAATRKVPDFLKF